MPVDLHVHHTGECTACLNNSARIFFFWFFGWLWTFSWVFRFWHFKAHNNLSGWVMAEQPRAGPEVGSGGAAL